MLKPSFYVHLASPWEPYRKPQKHCWWPWSPTNGNPSPAHSSAQVCKVTVDRLYPTPLRSRSVGLSCQHPRGLYGEVAGIKQSQNVVILFCRAGTIRTFVWSIFGFVQLLYLQINIDSYRHTFIIIDSVLIFISNYL